MTVPARTPVAADRQHAALQTIFSFSLGLMVLAFIGVGWVIFSGNSVTRFVVVAFALAVAIALGWVKFVRQRAATSAPPAGGQAARGGAGDAALAVLEARAAAAAAALAGSPDRRIAISHDLRSPCGADRHMEVMTFLISPFYDLPEQCYD